MAWWTDQHCGVKHFPLLVMCIYLICLFRYLHIFKHPSTSLPLTIHELFVYLFLWKSIQKQHANKQSKQRTKQTNLKSQTFFFEYLNWLHFLNDELRRRTTRHRRIFPSWPWSNGSPALRNVYRGGCLRIFFGSDRVIQVPLLMRVWCIYIYNLIKLDSVQL